MSTTAPTLPLTLPAGLALSLPGVPLRYRLMVEERLTGELEPAEECACGGELVTYSDHGKALCLACLEELRAGELQGLGDV